MSRHPFDSFLPSGAIESPRAFPSSSSMVMPRSIPDFNLSLTSSATPSPTTFIQSRSPSKVQNGPPISPPKTRSGSAEESSAALVENWRTYTDRLRSQGEGERRHMIADRVMMEEVMAEERALWEQERAILKARIAELEVQLDIARGTHAAIPHSATRRPGVVTKRSTSSESKAGSAAGSHDSSLRTVPQESGRDADGTPFYAPAPQNPSRTFDNLETSNLRVDSISAHGEDPIRVTSKELTASDFGLYSPTNGHNLETIPEFSPKSIDISRLQPTLEGVAIKASAVSPTFVAKVLSPQKSPQRLSPDKKPSPRDATNLSPIASGSREERAKKTLEVATQPENMRLTMHAGHTPSHSITNFTTLLGTDGESGNATPTQAHHDLAENGNRHPGFVVGGSEDGTDDADDEAEDDDGDQELSGQLGLTNNTEKDDPFLKMLVEKLEQARRSNEVTPSGERSDESVASGEAPGDGDDEEKDDGPTLRLKPSVNFGKPLGQA